MRVHHFFSKKEYSFEIRQGDIWYPWVRVHSELAFLDISPIMVKKLVGNVRAFLSPSLVLELARLVAIDPLLFLPDIFCKLLNCRRAKIISPNLKFIPLFRNQWWLFLTIGAQLKEDWKTRLPVISFWEHHKEQHKLEKIGYGLESINARLVFFEDITIKLANVRLSHLDWLSIAQDAVLGFQSGIGWYVLLGIEKYRPSQPFSRLSPARVNDSDAISTIHYLTT